MKEDEDEVEAREGACSMATDIVNMGGLRFESVRRAIVGLR
jgi:hypothetical protein